MKNRNINLDVIRCVALFYIIAVHFFMHSGFYYLALADISTYTGTILRGAFAACVPLFLILSGYLMNKKTPSLKYYKGISKVLILYSFSCIPIWIYRTIYLNETFDLSRLLGSYFNYELYAWYMNLYVCLYLIVPFLNAMYHGLKNRNQKLLLVIVFVILTAFPSTLNRFIGFSLFPSYFETYFPLTYYFLGAFLSEFAEDIKLPPLTSFIAYLLVVISGGMLVNLSAVGGSFYAPYLFVDWNNLLNTISAPVLFYTLLKCDFSKLPNRICKIIELISLVSLQLYIVSYVFDCFVYEILNKYIIVFWQKLLLMPIVVLAVFIPSFMVALIIHYAYLGIKKISTP